MENLASIYTYPKKLISIGSHSRKPHFPFKLSFMADQYQRNENGATTTTTTITPLFSIVKNEIELVKPSKSTPLNTVLSFSSIDNMPDLETLTPTIFVYSKKPQFVAKSASHHDQDDPVSVMKRALSEALDSYYPLAGRIKRHDDGRLRLTCNAEGVPFLVAAVDCSLSSLNHLDGIDLEIAKQFVIRSPPANCPLVFQVTKFSCGGFIIGFGMSHSVCDGFGAAQFFKAVTELSRGESEVTVKPVWERERLLGKPNKELLQALAAKAVNSAVSPYLPTSDISHEFFSINRESVKRLKETLGFSTSGTSFTTIEALGAFVWRARFRALELNPNGKTSLVLTTGIRKLLSPPLPEGYYGNAFVSTSAELLGKELDGEPLSKAAEEIKERKRDVFEGGFIAKHLDTFETLIDAGKNAKLPATGAVMVLTDWRNLELMEEEMGFAWKVANITTLPWDMFGYVDLCFFLPPSKLDTSMKGGVKILVSLPKPAMAKFKEEIGALIC